MTPPRRRPPRWLARIAGAALATAQRWALRTRRAQLLLVIDDLAGATSADAIRLRHALVLQLVAIDILTRPAGAHPDGPTPPDTTQPAAT